MHAKIRQMFAIALILAIMAVSACSKPATISEKDAEATAEQFVKDHVKFFSKNGSSTVAVPEFKFENVRLDDQKTSYSIIMHVTATLNNVTKSNDLSMVLDKTSGKVTEFNGQKLSS